jgi:hypothetical protein
MNMSRLRHFLNYLLRFQEHLLVQFGSNRLKLFLREIAFRAFKFLFRNDSLAVKQFAHNLEFGIGNCHDIAQGLRECSQLYCDGRFVAQWDFLRSRNRAANLNSTSGQVNPNRVAVEAVFGDEGVRVWFSMEREHFPMSISTVQALKHARSSKRPVQMADGNWVVEDVCFASFCVAMDEVLIRIDNHPVKSSWFAFVFQPSSSFEATFDRFMANHPVPVLDYTDSFFAIKHLLRARSRLPRDTSK